MTEITIKILTEQSEEKTEQDLRNAIASAGYDVEELIVEVIEE